ncbi:MAG TPA: amidase, partial [Chloroflexota bacterium]|nr:amidase [Chloroflexota bacterium]
MSGLLSAVEIVEGVTRGRFGGADVVAQCLPRAERAEPKIRAFAQLDPRSIRDAAHACDSDISRLRTGKHDLPFLAAVPVAVKDIIDTAGIPTECGSALFTGRVPERDATLIQNLKRAGALIFGKTVTAECAFLHPGPTRNPWDLSRTPGGSSMGSAAAVAAGIIPLAVGTQTNGSIIRPAAFCGVVGFKPTSGCISTDGVLRFSGTLDTIGGFARTVEDVDRLCAVMAGEPLPQWWSSSEGPPA